MGEKPSPDVIKRVIDRLERPNQQSRSIPKRIPEDKRVRTQVEKAVDNAAQDPDATQD